jgi:DNA-binding transcriptional ArsR family regulator
MAAAAKPETTAAMLRHPLRVRILEVLNEVDMSAVQFANAGYAGEPDQNVLSSVSYHFRALAEADAIVAIKRRQVRGAVETTYRGAARAYFSDEEWADIPADERHAISRVMYQGLFARVESAMIEGTFDRRSDRWLVWRSMSFDEAGWADFTTALHRVDAEVEEIQKESEDRLSASGDVPVAATFGMLGFESPPVEP